jgi:LemA protein
MPAEIIIVCAVVITLYFIFTYNHFIRLRNKSEEAFATMDAYLKKRWDLIPSLVEVVKAYAAHEQETMIRVVQARDIAKSSKGKMELEKGEKALTAGLTSLLALTEAYPDLKANENFIQLQRQLDEIENDILQSRKYFNAVIKVFNTQRELFPSSIVARVMKLDRQDYFVITDSERKAV